MIFLATRIDTYAISIWNASFAARFDDSFDIVSITSPAHRSMRFKFLELIGFTFSVASILFTFVLPPTPSIIAERYMQPTISKSQNIQEHDKPTKGSWTLRSHFFRTLQPQVTSIPAMVTRPDGHFGLKLRRHYDPSQFSDTA